jgi:hypothetical protein
MSIPDALKDPQPQSKVEDLPTFASATQGETVGLHIEVDEEIEPSVEVTFIVTTFDPSVPDLKEPLKRVNFVETLQATKSKPRPGSAAKLGFRLPWVVKSGTDAGPPYEVEFIAQVTQKKDGVQLFTSTDAKLYVPVIRAVTSSADQAKTNDPLTVANDKLARVMMHEFHKPVPDKSKPAEFDPTKLKEFVVGLSNEQRSLLMNHKVANPDEGRLVIFITLYSRATCGDRLMGADYCEHGGARTQVRPNATFSVFHVRGPGKDVTLASHTEHFVVNQRNGDTFSFINGLKGKIDKNTKKPQLYNVATWLPEITEDADSGVMYSCFYSTTGKNIMSGNTMHGMINTVGCWMLFRNHNWPAPLYARLARANNDVARKFQYARLTIKGKLVICYPEFDKVGWVKSLKNTPRPWKEQDFKPLPWSRLRQASKDKLSTGKGGLSQAEADVIADELFWDITYDGTGKADDGIAAAGYDVRGSGERPPAGAVTAPSGRSSSYEKFLFFDWNYAYAWFFRHVVGIKYFSRTWDGDAQNNEFRVDATQDPMEKTFPRSEAGKLTDHDQDENGNALIHHDAHQAKKDNKAFVSNGDLFTKNALGFQTASSFVVSPGAQAFPTEKGKTVKDCFWADVFFYKEGDLPEKPWPPGNFDK